MNVIALDAKYITASSICNDTRPNISTQEKCPNIFVFLLDSISIKL